MSEDTVQENEEVTEVEETEDSVPVANPPLTDNPLVNMLAEKLFNEVTQYVELERHKAEKAPTLSEQAEQHSDDHDVQRFTVQIDKAKAALEKARDNLKNRLKELTGEETASEEKYGTQRKNLRQTAAPGIKLLEQTAIGEPDVLYWLESVKDKFERKSGGGTAKPASDTDASKVREWAKANGITVSERGRIKAEVMDQYNAANVAA